MLHGETCTVQVRSASTIDSVPSDAHAEPITGLPVDHSECTISLPMATL